MNDLKDDIKTSVNKIREVYNDLISQILAKDLVIMDLENTNRAEKCSGATCEQMTELLSGCDRTAAKTRRNKEIQYSC